MNARLLESRQLANRNVISRVDDGRNLARGFRQHGRRRSPQIPIEYDAFRWNAWGWRVSNRERGVVGQHRSNANRDRVRVGSHPMPCGARFESRDPTMMSRWVDDRTVGR